MACIKRIESVTRGDRIKDIHENRKNYIILSERIYRGIQRSMRGCKFLNFMITNKAYMRHEPPKSIKTGDRGFYTGAITLSITVSFSCSEWQ